ncbi:MAG TPA: hypothetical protein VF009_06650 [Solirubrobacterales bacterium]
MAQTQSKSKAKKPAAKKRAGSSPKSKSQSKPKAKSAGSKPQSSNGAGPVSTVGKAASKVKLPLVAGGAALAGAAGGMALAATKGAGKSGVAKKLARRPKVKIDSGDMAKAAKEVGNFGAQVGQLANELQRARESADGGKKHRSPVEVVLQGLTARR